MLTLLRELEADHLARTKTAVRIKKEEEAAGAVSAIIPGEKHPSNVEVIQNLRTIEVEVCTLLNSNRMIQTCTLYYQAIKYLSAPQQSTIRQTEAGVTRLSTLR